MWLVDGRKLRRGRIEAGLSALELADKSGVALRTIQAIEAARAPSRARPATVRDLAGALGVATTDIARVDAEPAARRREASSPPPSPASTASTASTPSTPSTPSAPPGTPTGVETSRLSALVEEEEAAGLPPRERGGVPYLTARALSHVYTAYELHVGLDVVLEGRVRQERGIPPQEAALLGGRMGVAARFFLEHEVLPGRTLQTTVHAVEPALVKALQHALARVATVRASLVATPFDGDPPRGFSAFHTTKPRPWTFVAREVLAAEAGRQGDAGGRKATTARGKTTKIAPRPR